MSSDQKWLETETRDIGAGGICLITNYAIPIGKSFDVKFYIPDKDRPVKVIGKVMWNEKLEDENPIKYYNGIQFVQINKNDKEFLLKYVESATFERR